MPCFRTRSARRPRGQAPLCHCTRRAIAIRAEGTLGSLRYPLGGDHPSQTTRRAVSPPHRGVSARARAGPYFNGGSPPPGGGGSKPPAYPTRRGPRRSAELQ